MAKPKYANGKTQRKPAPLQGVLVPRDENLPTVVKPISNNPELERYADLTKLHVLQMWSALASVDVHDIVRVEKQSCRFCHGIEHRYQWASEEEWANDTAQRIDSGREPWDSSGGFGFRPDRQPDSACPHCFGEGIATVAISDYRNLSPAARLLYNGAKMGKNGIEVSLRDRDAILDRIAKHLGMFKDEIKHTGSGVGGAIQFILSPAEAAL